MIGREEKGEGNWKREFEGRRKKKIQGGKNYI